MSFRTSRGGSPEVYIRELGKAATVRPEDCLMLGNHLKANVLDRTSRGVDVEGRAFASYSTKGPYYYYPTKLSARGRRAKNVLSAYGRSGHAAEAETLATEQGSRRRAAQRLHRKLGKEGTRTRVGIKFESYAAFKRALGRFLVDLTGPRAPHMLQGLMVRALDGAVGFVLGIYGEPALRARGHQEGNPKCNLPQRKFLGATQDDRKSMLGLLSSVVHGRIKSVIGR